jgi:hypothetical protein
VPQRTAASISRSVTLWHRQTIIAQGWVENSGPDRTVNANLSQ